MSIFKTHIRAQSCILKLVATLIATSATIITFAQEQQKQSPENPAESAQDNQSESKKKEDNVIICDFGASFTTINFSVTDGNNRPIPSLRLKDFAIFEDDARQRVEFWIADSSVILGLAFDISDRESLKFMARQAAWGLLRQMRAADYFAIPQLKTDNETVIGFAADKHSFENAVSGISSNIKLLDLVSGAFKSGTETRWNPRGAVVVITDCRSFSGTISDRDEAYAILRRNTPVYFIILDDGSYGAQPAIQARLRRTRNLLTQLARVSGGLALVVNREHEISAATERIVERLRNQHTVGYYSTNEKRDGSFRNIRVAVTSKDKRKMKVVAPSGYYAVDP